MENAKVICLGCGFIFDEDETYMGYCDKCYDDIIAKYDKPIKISKKMEFDDDKENS